jgi:HNH endonuclease
MSTEIKLFGPLKRREKYETKPNGSFYAYSHYRVAIAEDCGYRCVYCDNHEDVIGGREAMEIDHFRPWQKIFGPLKEKRFEHLKNEPKNLVHSCGVCNGYKRDFWPTEDTNRSHDDFKGWIEPFDECRSDFLKAKQDGTLDALKAPAEYQIRKLRLNRPLLARLREHYLLKNRLQAMMEICKPKWQAVVSQNPGSPHAQTATEALELMALIQQLLNAKC